MGRPRGRRGGGGGVGIRSIRRISWTRTLFWSIIEKPPVCACKDTRHPRRLLIFGQVPRRFLFMTGPHLTYSLLLICETLVRSLLLGGTPRLLGYPLHL